MDTEGMEQNTREICAKVAAIALEAGKLIIAARSGRIAFSCKKNSSDIVTATDKAVEDHIKENLEKVYPSYSFIGEESYISGQTLTEAPTFIVDPIDGTSNFVHGLPDVCISIGLAVNKQPVVGVVHAPFHDEVWMAASGYGAFHKVRSGPVTALPSCLQSLQGLSSACVGIEWGSDRAGPNFEANVSVFLKLARTQASGGGFVNAIRATGSAAIAMCRVAAGQQDCFFEAGCWAWDVAAAWCIVREVGGLVVDLHPGNWNPSLENRRYLVVRSADQGQKEFVEEFWSVVGKDRWTYGP